MELPNDHKAHTYIGIRKMKWDQLWHALWETSAGNKTWDRVTREQAMYIEKKL